MGKPVITTAYGGQSDFCNPDTAWLCDYSFAYAHTHFDATDLVWVEPDAGSLARLLREVLATNPTELSRRAEWPEPRSKHFTWDQVAQRTQSAVAAVRSSSSGRLRLPTIGVISTRNSRRGIAAYTGPLLGGIDPVWLRVFASKAGEVPGKPTRVSSAAAGSKGGTIL